jgi:hypothetical protein
MNEVERLVRKLQMQRVHLAQLDMLPATSLDLFRRLVEHVWRRVDGDYVGVFGIGG